MSLRHAMGWIALGFGGLIITVLVWGIFSPTLPIGVTWWPFLLVAAGLGVKYIFGANKTGLFISVVGVALVLAFTVLGVEQYLPGNTNNTSVVAGGQPSPPNGDRRLDESNRHDQTPETLGARIARWNGPEMANQGLPSLVSMAIFGLAIATVLYSIFAVARKGSGKWPQRIGGFTVFIALLYGGAVALWGTERVHGAIQYVANETPLPGSTAAGGGGNARTSSGPRTPPALNAAPVMLSWDEAITRVAFQPLAHTQGCLRWTVDTETFTAISGQLGANPTSHFGWEVRSGGNGPKPTPQLITALDGRSTPTVFVGTFPC